jgi:hypothetical protein
MRVFKASQKNVLDGKGVVEKRINIREDAGHSVMQARDYSPIAFRNSS